MRQEGSRWDRRLGCEAAVSRAWDGPQRAWSPVCVYRVGTGTVSLALDADASVHGEGGALEWGQQSVSVPMRGCHGTEGVWSMRSWLSLQEAPSGVP